MTAALTIALVGLLSATPAAVAVDGGASAALVVVALPATSRPVTISTGEVVVPAVQLKVAEVNGPLAGVFSVVGECVQPVVAPVKAAILPLVPRDEGMATRARALYEELRRHHVVEHDDSGQIGRRYRRQDEIGTPWAFTIDEQTLEDETVTVRDRDSLAQERLPLSGVREWLDEALQRDWRSPRSS